MTLIRIHIVTALMLSIILVMTGCSGNRHRPEQQASIVSLVETFDKDWLSSDRDRFVFHDRVTKSRYLGDGWDFDSADSLNRFPWPRFTHQGGYINLDWNHRMERRMIVKLLNISPSYPKDLIEATLNGQVLPMLDDHPVIGEYEFYLPSVMQNTGQNTLHLKIRFDDLPAGFQAESIGLHSIRITLGAVVRNSIRIGDQVRNSLLFAPPVGLKIPCDARHRQSIQFSYGLYSPVKHDDEAVYKLKVALYETGVSRPLVEKEYSISRTEKTRTQWHFKKQKLPAMSKSGYLEISFFAEDESSGSTDYLALSEVMLLPEKQTWMIKTDSVEPDIAFVTLSSVSASQLGCYGNMTARTPLLDRLSRSGRLYMDMTAASNHEISSLMSMATGKLPRDHGLYRDMTKPRAPHHMFTALVADTHYQSHGFGFTQPEGQDAFSRMTGFRRVYLSDPERESFDTLRGQLAAMLNAPYIIANPGFYWFHLAPPLVDTSGTPPIFDLTDYHHSPIPLSTLNMPASEQERLQGLSGADTPVDDVRVILAANDQRVSTLDKYIETVILDIITRRPQTSLSLVITADHGLIRSVTSNLLSTDSLSQEILHVPFICNVINPKSTVSKPVPAIVSPPVTAIRTYDLMANLIRRGDFMKLTGNGTGSTPVRAILSEHHSRPIVAYRRDNLKMIHCFSNPYFQIATTNLFNLDEDPAESVNLVGRDPETARQLLDPIMAFCRESPFYPRPRMGIEEEALAVLQSLKYTSQ